MNLKEIFLGRSYNLLTTLLFMVGYIIYVRLNLNIIFLIGLCFGLVYFNIYTVGLSDDIR